MARVMDQSVGFLQFVDRCGLVPGVTVSTDGKEEMADAIRVRRVARMRSPWGPRRQAKFK